MGPQILAKYSMPNTNVAMETPFHASAVTWLRVKATCFFHGR
jgi:hypothetical protein